MKVCLYWHWIYSTFNDYLFEGLNSVQSYSLDGINSDDFDVDYSSIEIPYLIVRSSLDRSSYFLTLIASDNGRQPTPRTGSIQLNIRIINNNSIPMFFQTVYSIDVREDISIGTTLLKIQAISENNERIFYELLTESPFIIDRLTGNIQLKDFLDYERDKSYRLTVKAYENLIPTYAIIFIHVIDINDNPVLIHIKIEGK
jgi:cadherin domain-containing protein